MKAARVPPEPRWQRHLAAVRPPQITSVRPKHPHRLAPASRRLRKRADSMSRPRAKSGGTPLLPLAAAGITRPLERGGMTPLWPPHYAPRHQTRTANHNKPRAAPVEKLVQWSTPPAFTPRAAPPPLPKAVSCLRTPYGCRRQVFRHSMTSGNTTPAPPTAALFTSIRHLILVPPKMTSEAPGLVLAQAHGRQLHSSRPAQQRITTTPAHQQSLEPVIVIIGSLDASRVE